jgi:hypothetical protein
MTDEKISLVTMVFGQWLVVGTMIDHEVERSSCVGGR